MPIKNPNQLVEEYKKSGEFDRLRKQLLAEFQAGDSLPTFLTRVEDIAKERLSADTKLQYMAPEAAQRELMQELERYPVVERAAADTKTISDPAFIAGIKSSVTDILRKDRGGPLSFERPTLDTQNSNGSDAKSTTSKGSTALPPFLPQRPDWVDDGDEGEGEMEMQVSESEGE